MLGSFFGEITFFYGCGDFLGVFFTVFVSLLGSSFGEAGRTLLDIGFFSEILFSDTCSLFTAGDTGSYLCSSYMCSSYFLTSIFFFGRVSFLDDFYYFLGVF